jgi:hypothetical protein
MTNEISTRRNNKKKHCVHAYDLESHMHLSVCLLGMPIVQPNREGYFVYCCLACVVAASEESTSSVVVEFGPSWWYGISLDGDANINECTES